VAGSVITDEMRSIVGKTNEVASSYPVAASDIRRWAMAVYYPETPPRIYWDEEFAATTPYGGIVAPEEFNPFAWGSPSRARAAKDSPQTAGPSDEDVEAATGGALEARMGVRGPSLTNFLNGGVENEYTGIPIRPGDVIRSTSGIAEYKEREGRLGVMLFTTMETRMYNQRDELVRIQRVTIIRY
jgi:hypothetical protein